MRSDLKTTIDPIGDNPVLDESIIQVLPAGCRVLRTSPAPPSDVLTTIRIDVRLSDGALASYFKKGARGPLGASMCRGFFTAESDMFMYLPEHVPKPIGFGSYHSDPDMHFFVCDYVEMKNAPPSPAAFARLLADLHLRSMGRSPVPGRFGYPVDTHCSFLTQPGGFVDTVADWFGRWLRRLDAEERSSRTSVGILAEDDEYNALFNLTVDRVVPRLLGALERDGRKVVPCLTHNDTWPGNMKLRADSEKEHMVIFDGCCYWGHNEADLLCIVESRYLMSQEHANEYFKIVPPSEPKEEVHDRLLLYSMRAEALMSAMNPEMPHWRELFKDKAKTLVDKYQLLGPADGKGQSS